MKARTESHAFNRMPIEVEVTDEQAAKIRELQAAQALADKEILSCFLPGPASNNGFRDTNVGVGLGRKEAHGASLYLLKFQRSLADYGFSHWDAMTRWVLL